MKKKHPKAPSHALDRDDGLGQTRAALGEAFARMCGLYGANPLLGRLYALLLLSREPASLEALARDAGVARSSASVAMRRLVDACVARRLPSRSDRRDYYEAVVDPDEVMRGWWQRYFEPEVRIWKEALDATRSELDARDRDGALRARLDRLASFAGDWERLLEAMAGGAQIERRPMTASQSARRRRIAVEFEDDEAGGGGRRS